MEQRGNGAEVRRVVYCLVPRDLAPKLHDHLREHWSADPGIRVIVERRTDDRRQADRRAEEPGALEARQRRRIRNRFGRRIADRRATTVSSDPPPLPRRARGHADRLVFIERFEPAAQRLLDIDAARLVIRLQAGDQSAMSELYLRYFDSVYRYARVALRDPHEAEDVTQQVFTNVFHALPNYEVRPAVPFRAWLFRIVRNALTDTVRRKERLTVEDPGTMEARRDMLVSQEAEQILPWLDDGDLSVFIERLPQSQREVLMLRFMLDLTPQEIAQVVGRTPKAVRRLQERALKTLEERLVAIGRIPQRKSRAPMWIRLKPVPVVSARRFALANPPRPLAVLGRRAGYVRRP